MSVNNGLIVAYKAMGQSGSVQWMIVKHMVMWIIVSKINVYLQKHQIKMGTKAEWFVVKYLINFLGDKFIACFFVKFMIKCVCYGRKEIK